MREWGLGVDIASLVPDLSGITTAQGALIVSGFALALGAWNSKQSVSAQRKRDAAAEAVDVVVEPDIQNQVVREKNTYRAEGYEVLVKVTNMSERAVYLSEVLLLPRESGTPRPWIAQREIEKPDGRLEHHEREVFRFPFTERGGEGLLGEDFDVRVTVTTGETWTALCPGLLAPLPAPEGG